MAAGLLERRSAGRIRVRSAGSDPSNELNPVVIEGMREVGVEDDRAGHEIDARVARLVGELLPAGRAVDGR